MNESIEMMGFENTYGYGYCVGPGFLKEIKTKIETQAKQKVLEGLKNESDKILEATNKIADENPDKPVPWDLAFFAMEAEIIHQLQENEN